MCPHLSLYDSRHFANILAYLWQITLPFYINPSLFKAFWPGFHSTHHSLYTQSDGEPKKFKAPHSIRVIGIATGEHESCASLWNTFTAATVFLFPDVGCGMNELSGSQLLRRAHISASVCFFYGWPKNRKRILALRLHIFSKRARNSGQIVKSFIPNRTQCFHVASSFFHVAYSFFWEGSAKDIYANSGSD